MKKMLAGLGLLGTALLATSASAADQPRWPNWYVGVHGGVGWYPNADIEAVNVGTAELSTEVGWYGGIALGYLPRTTMAFFDQSRFEVEYSHRVNANDTLGPINALDGDTTVKAVMANMYYDFLNTTVFTPYLGAGIGYAQLSTDNSGVNLEGDVFAWQFMAGVSFEPKTMPMTVWSLGYRYFGTEDAEYGFGGINYEQEYNHNGLEASARFRF